MGEKIELTEAEEIAKKHFLLIVKDAQNVPCDFNISVKDEGLPAWYDKELYKRGQKFYEDNRCGILYSNLVGLICLLAEPQGLQILRMTGRSSTPETARKRYVSTIVHTFTWYDMDLSPGPKLFDSLKKVRKLHYLASKMAEENGFGYISQAELTVTLFGFMGFALIRPTQLGIRGNDDDKKAFIHFWGIIGYMLGIHDCFNLCLLPFDGLIVFCQMILRYILLPIIQLQTPEFEEMVRAMLIGLKPYIPTVNYEVDLFCSKLLCMVPGYQYNVDYSKEILCRSIITQDDIEAMKEFLVGTKRDITGIKAYLSVDIPIIEVIRGHSTNNNASEAENIGRRGENPELIEFLRDVMKLGPADYLSIRYINYEKDWQKSLNDSKLMELSMRGRFTVRLKALQLAIYNSTIGRYLAEWLVDRIVSRIKNAGQKYTSPASRQVQSA